MSEDNFRLIGIEIETLQDGGFHLRQQKFVDQLELMSLNQRFSRADTDKLTTGKLTQLRGVPGSANWLAHQTRPDLCVGTSLYQGSHASATVADTREANKLFRLSRQHAHVPIRVSPIPLDDLTLVGFGDCGLGVRRNGSSQGGSLIIAVDKRIFGWFRNNDDMVVWKSYKCKRVARSSFAGETQAYVETLDMLELTKMFYALFLDPWKSLSDVESIFEKQHKSPVSTDAKSLYDAVERSESSTRNLTERRTAIEVTAIRQRLEHGFIFSKWVNFDRQMAKRSHENLRRFGSCLRSCLWENGKSFGAPLSGARKLKVAERSAGKRDFDG